LAPELCENRPSFEEGAGNAGRAMRTRSLARKAKSAQVSHRRSPETPGIPRANGFNGFLRALPGEPGFLATIALRIIPQDLTPASGRQDHTASPSASQSALVRSAARVHRIPPAVRDDRETPLARAGWLEVYCCF
jgi:hypothetical protein